MDSSYTLCYMSTVLKNRSRYEACRVQCVRYDGFRRASGLYQKFGNRNTGWIPSIPRLLFHSDIYSMWSKRNISVVKRIQFHARKLLYFHHRYCVFNSHLVTLSSTIISFFFFCTVERKIAFVSVPLKKGATQDIIFVLLVASKSILVSKRNSYFSL